MVIKLNANHYAIKILERMFACGAGGMQIGAITATLHYPEDNTGAYTLTLIHNAINEGVIFNILQNTATTTIIESKIDNRGGVWYRQHKTIPTTKALTPCPLPY